MINGLLVCRLFDLLINRFIFVPTINQIHFFKIKTMMRYSLILILAIIIIAGCKEGTPSEGETKIPSTSVTSDDDSVKIVEGIIYDMTPLYVEGGALEIFMEDKNGKEVYLDFYREVNPAKYDEFPEDFEIEIRAFYKIKKQGDEDEQWLMQDYELITENEAEATETK